MTPAGRRCPRPSAARERRHSRDTTGATFPKPLRPCASSGCRYVSSEARRTPHQEQCCSRTAFGQFAGVRQKIHLSLCPNLRGQLSPSAARSSRAATRSSRRSSPRFGALGQNPRLLRIAPVAPPPAPRDHLDALIRVGIMPGLMHGMSAPRVVEHRASLAQPDPACEVGPSYRLRSIVTSSGARPGSARAMAALKRAFAQAPK